MFVVFSGLPGTGKSTLARLLAQRLGAVYLRIDTIERALLASEMAQCVDAGAAYLIAYDLAEDNLRMGRHVVADFSQCIADYAQCLA